MNVDEQSRTTFKQLSNNYSSGLNPNQLTIFIADDMLIIKQLGQPRQSDRQLINRNSRNIGYFRNIRYLKSTLDLMLYYKLPTNYYQLHYPSSAGSSFKVNTRSTGLSGVSTVLPAPSTKVNFTLLSPIGSPSRK